MNTSNLKDTLSTIVGIVGGVAASILTAEKSGLVLPAWVAPVCNGVVAVSTIIFGVLMGKNPDGTTKTTEQTAKLNNPNPISNPIVTPPPSK